MYAPQSRNILFKWRSERFLDLDLCHFLRPLLRLCIEESLVWDEITIQMESLETIFYARRRFLWGVKAW
jgi:hypothetical protein